LANDYFIKPSFGLTDELKNVLTIDFSKKIFSCEHTDYRNYQISKSTNKVHSLGVRAMSYYQKKTPQF